jgi:hypothetical protein
MATKTTNGYNPTVILVSGNPDSLEWWKIVIRLVDSVLDVHGPDAFAFHVGFGKMSCRDEHGNRELLTGLLSSRWKYETEARKVVGGTPLRPTVLVVTAGTYGLARPSGNQKILDHSAPEVIIMPHSSNFDRTGIELYLRWVDQGASSSNTRWLKDDRIHQRFRNPPGQHLAPAITGFMEDGKWRDPSDLETVLQFVLTNYHLKIGLWDLVDDPVWCRTVLGEQKRVVLSAAHRELGAP